MTASTPALLCPSQASNKVNGQINNALYKPICKLDAVKRDET